MNSVQKAFLVWVSLWNTYFLLVKNANVTAQIQENTVQNVTESLPSPRKYMGTSLVIMETKVVKAP